MEVVAPDADQLEAVNELLSSAIDTTVKLVSKTQNGVTKEGLQDLWSDIQGMSALVQKIVSCTRAPEAKQLHETTTSMLKQLLVLIKAYKMDAPDLSHQQEELFLIVELWKQDAKSLGDFLANLQTQSKSNSSYNNSNDPWDDFDFDRYQAYGETEKADPLRIKVSPPLDGYSFLATVTDSQRVGEHMEYRIRITTNHPDYRTKVKSSTRGPPPAANSTPTVGIVEYSVSRRYNQFESLHEKLTGMGFSLPILPPKHIRNLTESVVNERVKGFDTLLYFIAREERLYANRVVKEFLTPDYDFPRKSFRDSFSLKHSNK